MPIKALFKKDLKLSRMLLLILTLLFVFQYPLQMVLEIGQLRELNATTPSGLIYNVFASSAVSVFIIMAIVVLGGLLIGLERNTRRHDFSLSLPVSRKKMFAVKAAIGLGTILILFSLNVFLAYVILWTSEYSGALANFDFLTMYLMPMLAYMAIFSFTLFIGTISGEMISQIVLSFIFMIFPFGFPVLVSAFIAVHGLQQPLMGRLGVVLGVLVTDFRAEHAVTFILAALALILIASLFVGTMLYAKGKSERDGEFLLFTSLKPVFLIGIVGCFAMLGGTIFSVFGYTAGGAISFYWIGALIFGGISWIITKRLLQMNLTMKSN